MASRSVIIIQLRNPVGKEEPLPVLRVYDDVRMLRLKRAFFEDTLCQIAPIEHVDLKVAVAPPSRVVWVREACENLATRFATRRSFHSLPARCHAMGQQVTAIERRTADNLRAALDEGYKQIILVSGFVPTLRTELVADALRHLNEHSIILGPTIEGGSYLIGLRADCPEAVGLLSIGTDSSYADSTTALSEAGLPWQEIDLCYDVSHQEDLEFIVREINHARFTGDEEVALCTETVLSDFMNESEPNGSRTASNGRRSAANE